VGEDSCGDLLTSVANVAAGSREPDVVERLLDYGEEYKALKTLRRAQTEAERKALATTAQRNINQVSKQLAQAREMEALDLDDSQLAPPASAAGRVPCLTRLPFALLILLLHRPVLTRSRSPPSSSCACSLPT
jgi:hypothetical protein